MSKQECTQCPHVVGDIYERDCGFPDCIGGWEQAFISVNAKYNELLFAVERKFPNETRHETALRYILEAESKENQTECAVKVGE